jgi:hypothetical protein
LIVDVVADVDDCAPTVPYAFVIGIPPISAALSTVLPKNYSFSQWFIFVIYLMLAARQFIHLRFQPIYHRFHLLLLAFDLIILNNYQVVCL